MKLDDHVSKARAVLREDQPAGHNLFEELIDQHPDARSNILRERSLGYAEIGQFEKALADRGDVADSDASRGGDLYFAGEYAMQAGALSQAVPYFERCIELSVRQQSGYYLNSARLLAALCRCRLGDRVGASALLGEVPDDTSVMWLEGFDDEINKASVLRDLMR
jgi:tetratricopeptide (TPR) repeat protein